MWPVCPTQVPSSPQQAGPGSWLPALGGRDRGQEGAGLPWDLLIVFLDQVPGLMWVEDRGGGDRD